MTIHQKLAVAKEALDKLNSVIGSADSESAEYIISASNESLHLTVEAFKKVVKPESVKEAQMLSGGSVHVAAVQDGMTLVAVYAA